MKFVIMPNHFHLLLNSCSGNPAGKGTAIHQGRFLLLRETGNSFCFEIWQASFVSHRIRDAEDYKHHHTYIWQNLVRAGLSERPELFAWSSASLEMELDAPPRHQG
jgi:REP element-mobilizing transposase RayT